MPDSLTARQLDEVSLNASVKTLPKYAVELKGLTKTYKASGKSESKKALIDVDLAIPRGSVFGLLGPNGAGKSTMINILAGLVNKTSGSARIWDLDIITHTRQARAAIGVTRADGLPILTADAYGRRQSDSENTNFSVGTYNDYRAALNLSWEIDLWGRVRRQVRAAEADTDAAGYEVQAALLSLRAEIARAYADQCSGQS